MTIGIFAPWGSGESTLLNTLRNRITALDRKKKQCIIVNFNAWHQESNQELASSMLYRMGNAVKEWRKTNASIDKENNNDDPLGRLASRLITIGHLLGKTLKTTLQNSSLQLQLLFHLGSLSLSSANSGESHNTEDQPDDPPYQRAGYFVH